MAKKQLNNKTAAQVLAALGHDARLSVYRLLVRAGHRGLKVGEISEQLDIPASTLAHHLRALVSVGLVTQVKDGREVINKPDFDVIQEVALFLTKECCTGF